LLFEIICWVIARMHASEQDAITDPHLKATNQGTDCVKVTIDPTSRALKQITVYEYKCTTNSRTLFTRDVLKAFREYIDGARDNQLAQATNALLERLGLDDEQRNAAYEKLILVRPFGFQASLTVEPKLFDSISQGKLFAGFDCIAGDAATRSGNTLPLDDVRSWFADFAKQVWAKIEAFNVRL